MNKNNKQMRAARAKAEEEALNRILYWVAGGAVLEFLLLLLNRYWCHYGPATLQIRLVLGKVVPVLGIAALIGAGVFAWMWNKAHKEGKGVGIPAIGCLMTLCIGLGCAAAWFFGEPGILLMCFVVLAVTILAIIFQLYQREFFVVAAQGILGLIGLWLCSRGLNSGKAVFCYIYVVGAVAVLLAGAWLCRKLQGSKGAMERKGKKVRILAKDANYTMLYLGAGIAVLVLVCAAAGVPNMALWAVEVAWLAVMAVYYTVKLM